MNEEKKKLSPEDLKRMKEEIMGKPKIQLPSIPQNQTNRQSMDIEEQKPIQKKDIPDKMKEGLKRYWEEQRMKKNPQQQISSTPQKTGITKTQLNEILEENKVLTEQMSLLQAKMNLRESGEFNYQMLVIASQIVMSLQEIKKELNSISLQIYDSNKIQAGDSAEIVESAPVEEPTDYVHFDEEEPSEDDDSDLSED